MANAAFHDAVKQEEDYLRKVYPTAEDIPGCMNLFDVYLSCNAIRTQVKSLYRFGHMSTCGEKLEDFKFCLTMKMMHPEEKRDAWIKRRAEWWAKRRMTKSSEDVWEIRTEPLKNYPVPLSNGEAQKEPASRLLLQLDGGGRILRITSHRHDNSYMMPHAQSAQKVFYTESKQRQFLLSDSRKNDSVSLPSAGDLQYASDNFAAESIILYERDLKRLGFRLALFLYNEGYNYLAKKPVLDMSSTLDFRDFGYA
ncbi:hypothetical protein ONZ45_g16533 [Pleurotus djamor]|nr:hypothetical protein ONZ45_g16533 [Pleurotus djamor]